MSPRVCRIPCPSICDLGVSLVVPVLVGSSSQDVGAEFEVPNRT